MVKKFKPVTNIILSATVDVVETSLTCPKFHLLNHSIEVYILEDYKFSNPENKKLVEKGFGGCLFKGYRNFVTDPVIIFNTKKIVEANLTEREIAAVLFHELGHLLNELELEPEPNFNEHFTFHNNFNVLRNKIRSGNCLKMEIYADSYANRYGYGEEYNIYIPQAEQIL